MFDRGQVCGAGTTLRRSVRDRFRRWAHQRVAHRQATAHRPGRPASPPPATATLTTQDCAANESQPLARDERPSRAIPVLSSSEWPLRRAKRPQKDRFEMAGTGFEPVSSQGHDPQRARPTPDQPTPDMPLTCRSTTPTSLAIPPGSGVSPRSRHSSGTHRDAGPTVMTTPWRRRRANRPDRQRDRWQGG